jgi:hypothetical protein
VENESYLPLFKWENNVVGMGKKVEKLKSFELKST